MAHRYEVLGSLRVVGPDELTPNRPAHRRLLAVLVLERGRAVSRDLLIERLWGDDAPGHPINTLQAHVSAVRKLLGADAVRSAPSGYLLDVSGGVDATEFADHIARARRHRVEDDVEATLREVEAALALWRGDPYPELFDASFVRPEVVHLTELHAAATELRADALIQLGREVEAAIELEALVEARPHDERLWEHLMLARYRSGLQADALTAYHRARTALLDLGLEPGPRLRQLEQRILQRDPTLEPHAAAVELASRPGRSLSSALHRWRLVGRHAELELARRVLVDGGLGLVLVGAAGVGKSRLLQEIGASAAASGIQTVWIRANESLQSIPLGAASHLGPTAPGPMSLQLESMLEELRRQGGEQPVLLLVDDAQHLDEPTIALITHAVERRIAAVTVAVRAAEPVPAVTRWWTDVGLERVEIGRLPAEDVDALIDVALGRTAPATRRLLGELVAGNPLHLREVIRAAMEGGALIEEDGRWVLAREVADAGRLTELVETNMRQVGGPSREVMALLSLARPIALDVLADLVGLPAVDELVERDLVHVARDAQGVLVVDVTHPLYAENIVARLPPGRRRQLGTQLAEGLEARGFPASGDVLRTASLRLELGGLASGLAARACEEALMRLDADLALRLAEVATAGDAGTEAWRLRGRAAYYLGKPGEADGYLARAAALASTDEELVDVACERAGNLGFGRRDPAGGVAVLDEALARVAPSPASARLRVERSVLLAMHGRLRMVVAETEALSGLALPDEARLTVGVAGTMARALIGDVEGLDEEIAGLLAVAEPLRARFPVARDQLQANLGESLAAAGQVDEAVDVAREQVAQARTSGGLLSLALPQLVRLLALAGYVDEAARLGDDRGEDMRGPDPFQMSLLWPAYVALAQVQSGRVIEARETLQDGDRERAQREPRAAVWWQRSLGWLELPDNDRAAGLLLTAGREALDGEHVTWGALALYDVVRLGRPDLVVDDLLAVSAMSRGARLLEALADSAVAHVTASYGDLAEVADRLARQGAKLLAAEAWASCGRAAASAGDLDREHTAVAAAAELAAGLGAVTPGLSEAGLSGSPPPPPGARPPHR